MSAADYIYRVIMQYHKLVINMNIYLMYKASKIWASSESYLTKYVINVGDCVDI